MFHFYAVSIAFAVQIIIFSQTVFLFKQSWQKRISYVDKDFICQLFLKKLNSFSGYSYKSLPRFVISPNKCWNIQILAKINRQSLICSWIFAFYVKRNILSAFFTSSSDFQPPHYTLNIAYVSAKFKKCHQKQDQKKWMSKLGDIPSRKHK